jgi:Na+:H+ antiporter
MPVPAVGTGRNRFGILATPMNPFDVAAVLIAVAAIAGYLNHRFLRLPATSGILAVSLVTSIALVAADRFFANGHLHDLVSTFLDNIDFNEALMHGMLSFLLFAGALHVDLAALIEHRGTIGTLATLGVVLSAGIVGGLTWLVLRALGVEAPVAGCLLFGALISPTDPIAVMGLLKELKAPRALEAQIAGESLFNDGVGVVLFFAILSTGGLEAETGQSIASATGLTIFFVREVLGGALLGLALGYLAYRALKSIDDHPLELLITLALVMLTYSASFWIHVSGPIAVVVAGLLIGNVGRQFAMSQQTREHVDSFWRMMDDILNAVLFLLIGLEILALGSGWHAALVALLLVPVALAGRFVSVVLPVRVMNIRKQFEKGIVPILTWGGLRGGISVAMALSLPRFEARDYLLAATYAVVVFSILVQGTTMRKLLAHYGVGEAKR